MPKKSLDSFTVDHFKGLRDLKLENLGLINLFVGINNSGKTSLLEALAIYCDPSDITVWINTARLREQENRKERTPILDALRLLFPYESTNDLNKGSISMSGNINKEFSIKQLNASYEEVEELKTSEKSSIDNGEEGELESEEQELENEYIPEVRKGIKLKIAFYTSYSQRSILDGLPQPAFNKTFSFWEGQRFLSSSFRSLRISELSLPTAMVTPSSHRFESQTSLLSKAIFKKFKPDILALLQQIDKKISDILILPYREEISSSLNIFIEHQKLGLVPISIFGDGVRRLLNIAIKLASVEGGVLLIDEIESAIHTEALQESFRWIVKWCKEKNVQLFLTTHSLEAVDTLLAVTDDESDLVLYRLEPKDERTRVVRHGWERLKRLREEQGEEVRW